MRKDRGKRRLRLAAFSRGKLLSICCFSSECFMVVVMDVKDKKHAEDLLNALQELYHSGSDGFEGFLSVVMGHLTGQTYRLASSGTQRGRDGDSAFDGGATYFEGKRYKTSPDKKEISAKLFDLAIDEAGQVDLWVLGATCEVAAQTVKDAREFAALHGIGIVTLDWSDNDLGALLLATVAAGDDAKSFIDRGLARTGHSHLVAGASAAIDHFAAHAELPARLISLRQALTSEEVGLGHARALNRNWMEKRFSNRALARAEFGQPLAPLDTTGLVAVTRPEQSAIRNAFKGRPQSEFYAVIGEEGVGKSWICAKTWLELAPCSLLVVCPADDLLSPVATKDFETFLIQMLIRQTGWQPSERAVERWRRRLNGWRANPTPDNVRVTLVVDGLNQPRSADWSRWLDWAAAELRLIGGCLVVTTRSAHWTQLHRLLISKITLVPIDLWTIPDVKSLLVHRGIDSEKVSLPVLESLRNPRILGIAVDLLEVKDVELIGQLSVGRLIFEHIRKAQFNGAVSMSGIEFAELLKKLGEEVLKRIQQQEADDLRLFDSTTKEELHAVATCRFFAPVPGASLQYEIKPEGLNIGLALALISALEKEHRNHRDPRDHLGTILEPIGALDETAAVVFLATQIACLEGEISGNVKTALIECFVSLQNLPTGEADAFALLVKASPSAFLIATKNVHCSSGHYPNVDWLLYALLAHRDTPQVWPAIAEHIKHWLSLYSLAPERMMFKTTGRDPADEVAAERQTRSQVLDKTVANLTAHERAFVDANLIAADSWNFETLLRTAFYLLAGRPLQDFAAHFVRWSFSDAYGPALHAVDKEFRQLIRFNRLDWSDTRSALLKELAQLEDDKTSSVGKWARVEVLRATGAVDDAKEAEKLAEWLTRDRERLPGWSLREKYCAADPCDPNSSKPDNVDETAAQYRQIDPSELANHMGQSGKDHFFNMARCGVVRFHEADAATAHRAFADNVLARNGFPRRQGIIQLVEHSSVLTAEQVKRFLHAGQSSTVSYEVSSRNGKDEWLTAQYSVWLAIPHLAPDDQLDAIANIQGEVVILNTFRTLRPASEAKVEQVLERALQSGNTNIQSAVLGAVQYSRPVLSGRALQLVAKLCQSKNGLVRGQALGVAAFSDDLTLLKAVVDCGWDARSLRSDKDTFELWYGSSAILRAAQAGHITIENALDRMHLDHFGFVASELGPAGASAVALRVEASLLRALGYTEAPSLPNMSTATPKHTDRGPPLISLSDPPPQDQEAQWNRVGETAAQFDERQQRASLAFKKFSTDLTATEATLILSDLTFDGVKAILEVNLEAGKRWLTMLIAANDTQLRHLHHVAYEIAIASAVLGVAEATALIERIATLTPTINRVSGAAKLPTEALLLWKNADAPSIEAVCKKRLHTRRKDSEISGEVLAAFLSGKGDIVGDVIDELISKGEPTDICLALTLAGYSDTNNSAASIIARFDGIPGFVGAAQRAAKSAYERNVWSKVWYKNMIEANEKENFWQAAVLLAKIVDARFDIWSSALGPGRETFAAFKSTTTREIERRIEKWQKKREDTLFGDKSPADLFLPG